MADVRRQVEALMPDLVAVRRDLHQHPELAFHLERTPRVVAEQLEALGLEVQTGVGGQGVVALVRGRGPGKVLAIRPDMDALPYPDAKLVPYASRVSGLIHGCGHDAHTAIGIGIARVLSQRRDQFQGAVKLIFDPAEEAGGASEALGNPPCGPKALRAAGVLENPHVDALMAYHNLPEIPVGQVWVRAGVIFTGYDNFSVTITGQETHAARRHEGRDAVLAAAHVVQALYGAATRFINPTTAFSLNVGNISGGKAHNLIAEMVQLEGTVRCGHVKERQELPERLRSLAVAAATSAGCTAEFHFVPGNPPVVNDPEMARLLARSAAQVLGKENVVWMETPLMIGDTYCFLAEGLPSVYWLLGSGNPARGITYPLHHSLYDIDEAAIAHGVAVSVAMCLNYLGDA
jgi:amidohydrolase